MSDHNSPGPSVGLRSRVAALADQGHSLQDARATVLKERIDELSSDAARRPSAIVAQQAAKNRAVFRIRTDGPAQRRGKSASLPSWFTSAVVHSVLILGLAIFTHRAGFVQTPFKITAPPAHKEVALKFVPPVLLKPPPVNPDELSLDDENDPGIVRLGAPPVIKVPMAAVGIPASRFTVDDLGLGLGAAGRGLAKVGENENGAEFYGVQAAGNTFVFIVDSSISMVGKVDDLKRELEYAIRRLSKHQKFYVIFFDGNTERMRLGEWNRSGTKFAFNSMPEPDLVPASVENIDAFVRWLHTIRLEFNTNPYEATAFTLNKLKPDAIFLLSDGEFTDRGTTESYLRTNNITIDKDGAQRPKTAVHCIGFYSRAGEVTLQRIAETNGGTYRFVEAPPGYIPRFSMPPRR